VSAVLHMVYNGTTKTELGYIDFVKLWSLRGCGVCVTLHVCGQTGLGYIDFAKNGLRSISTGDWSCRYDYRYIHRRVDARS